MDDISEENGTELQASEILSLFRECGWLLPREIGRNGEYVVNISIDCRRVMDFLRNLTIIYHNPNEVMRVCGVFYLKKE